MRYKVEKIVEKEWGNEWYPQKRGRWEVRDESGKVVYSFNWKFKGDNAEWPEREWWTGPMEVRISDDGCSVECYYQTGIKHGIAFEHTLGKRMESHPLPPVEEE